MAEFHAFKTFDDLIYNPDLTSHRRLFLTRDGDIKVYTLPEPSPPYLQLNEEDLVLINRGSQWRDMRYIGQGAFVRRDLWLDNFTYRLRQAEVLL